LVDLDALHFMRFPQFPLSYCGFHESRCSEISALFKDVNYILPVIFCIFSAYWQKHLTYVHKNVSRGCEFV